MAWGTIPNAFLVSLWSSSRKPTIFLCAGLKTTAWKLWSAVAIDWSSTYFYRELSNFIPDSLGLSYKSFYMSAMPLHLWETEKVVVIFVLSELHVTLEASLEKVFKQLKRFGFPVHCGHSWSEWLWQLETLMKDVSKTCRIAVGRQLLKGQLYEVCFDCLKGVFTAELQLICRARFFKLAWRRSRGAVGKLFSNSNHHVKGILWVAIL